MRNDERNLLRSWMKPVELSLTLLSLFEERVHTNSLVLGL